MEQNLSKQAISQAGLSVVMFTQGDTATNAYLVAEHDGERALVIDPAWDGEAIRAEAARRHWRIGQILLTHAHFDHLGGVAALCDGSEWQVPVALHPDDHPLWQIAGGAALFGIQDFDPGPEPTIDLEHGMRLHLGDFELQVLHAPGHTPGHVLFYAEAASMLFCGDLIFAGSVGRTDLPGADAQALFSSIENHVLSLPDETLLLPGHGPTTSVGQERATNPFLAS